MDNTKAAAAAPGTPLPTVAIDIPSAQILADYASILQDLQFVMECCKRLLTELAAPEDDRDPVVPQALWSAALVAYARCFGTGRRFGLAAEDVRTLPLQGEVMKYHQWLTDERKRNISHSSKPFEAARVGAVLSQPEAARRQVQGIAVLSISHILVDETGVRQLGGLAAELAKQTAGKAQEQQDVVLADVQRLDIDRLYASPPLRSHDPAAEPAVEAATGTATGTAAASAGEPG
ncbi:MAG: hypothetical protein ABSA03_15255 [Streptosporangiaceae bacterium]|jgi:hypothetical protein